MIEYALWKYLLYTVRELGTNTLQITAVFPNLQSQKQAATEKTNKQEEQTKKTQASGLKMTTVISHLASTLLYVQ